MVVYCDLLLARSSIRLVDSAKQGLGLADLWQKVQSSLNVILVSFDVVVTMIRRIGRQQDRIGGN